MWASHRATMKSWTHSVSSASSGASCCSVSTSCFEIRSSSVALAISTFEAVAMSVMHALPLVGVQRAAGDRDDVVGAEHRAPLLVDVLAQPFDDRLQRRLHAVVPGQQLGVGHAVLAKGSGHNAA